MTTELGQPSPQDFDYRRFFQQNKQLIYHIAFAILQDAEAAEGVVAEAMLRIRTFGLTENTGFRDRNKGILCLLIRYLSFTQAQSQGRRLEGTEAQEEEARPKPAQEEALNRYLRAISSLRIRDRILLFLRSLYRLEPKEIAKLLQIREKTVLLRLDRSIDYLSRQLARGSLDADLLVQDFSFQRAGRIWIKEKLNTAEAVSNMDPHFFSQEVEEKILGDLEGRSQLSLSALACFREYGKFLSLGLLACLVLLLMVHGALKGGRKKEAGSEETQMSTALEEESQAPIRASRYVGPQDAAYFSDSILFIDQETQVLYRVDASGNGQRILDLADVLQEHFGIQYIGQKNDSIYLAFLDGRGATITGSPAQIRIEDYWQNAWFDGQESRPPFSRAVLDQVEYLFESSVEGKCGGLGPEFG